MDLGQLFIKSAQKKRDSKLDDILYVAMVEWGWTYDKFIKTPIPILIRILNVYKKVKKAEQKATKKK